MVLGWGGEAALPIFVWLWVLLSDPNYPSTRTPKHTVRLSVSYIYLQLHDGCKFLRILRPLFPSLFSKALNFSLYVTYNSGVDQSV
jgi:hypothetical protein